MRPFIISSAGVFLLFALSGCGSVNPAFQALGALVLPSVSPVDQAIANNTLNPAFRYLHVTPKGQPSFLAVLGYTDPHPAGPVHSWYAAGGQWLQTQQGRLIGLAGVEHGIRHLGASSNWSDWPSSAAQPVRAWRRWDAPARYRFGLEEPIAVHPITPDQLPLFVTRHLAGRLANPDTSQWHWYLQTGPLTGQAWFARINADQVSTVVYAYQCLESGLCLHMAPWPLNQGSL
jgi:hypothetical protein